MTRHQSRTIKMRIGEHAGRYIRNCSECHIGSGVHSTFKGCEKAWEDLEQINPTCNLSKQAALDARE